MEKFEINQNNNKETLKAPEGWRTIGSIATEHKATYSVLSKIADKYRSTHPEYFSDFRDRGGQRILQYCSPELVKIIEEKLNTFKDIPEVPLGWETNGTVFKSLNTGSEQVGNIADTYRETHPEYFGQFRHRKVGRVDEYYSPELVNIIKKKITESQLTPETPEGWKTVYGLAKELEVAFRTIEKIADTYRETNPEYFKNFKVNVGMIKGPIREHYAPQLVGVITREILENKNIPESPLGWRTLSSLYKELNSYSKMIAELANVYRNDHPDYFKNFRSENGKIYEYYSPELVALITEDLKKNNEVLPGWENMANLKRKLDVSSYVINNIINKYKDHKEYFKDFKAPIVGVGQYYSPELVEIIEKEAKAIREIQEPLPGWETNNSVTNMVEKDNITVSRFVNPFKITNPEYFKTFKTRTGLLTHYAPELVKLIKENFQQKNLSEAPEDWLSIDKIAEAAGVSKEEVERIARKLRQKYPDKFGKYKNKRNE